MSETTEITTHTPTGLVTPVLVSPGHVTTGFSDSLFSSALYDARSLRLLKGIVSVRSGSRLNQGRTDAVEAFFDESHLEDVEWLWLVDTDIEFADGALYQLLEVADPVERPIVCGLYIGGGFTDRQFPMLYFLTHNNPDNPAQLARANQYKPGSLIQVDATGAGFALIHRDVFVKVREHFGTTADGYPNPHPWFAEEIAYGTSYGEDVTFFLRARQCGYPIYVHTGVELRHNKTQDLTVETWLASGGRHGEETIAGRMDTQSRIRRRGPR